MNDLDELLRTDGRSWQAPPVAAPDLGAALDRSRQRRSRVASATALMAVVAVAAGAAWFANLPVGPIPAVPVAPSTPTGIPATPSPPASSPTGSVPLPVGGTLVAGSYAVHATSPIAGYSSITMTVPEGWAVDGGFVGTELGQPDEVALSFWNAQGAYGDGCDWSGSEVLRYIPGETGWFAHFPREASEATDVRLGGWDALRVELYNSPDLDVSNCEGGEYRSWYEWSGRVDSNHAPGQTDVAYVIRFDGAPLVVNASYRPDSTPADRAELDAVLASLRIEPAADTLEGRLARAALGAIPIAGTQPVVVSGQAVQTTIGHAEDLLGMGRFGSGPADTEVWVIQLNGQFECQTCLRPQGFESPSGPVLTIALGPNLEKQYAFGLSDAPAELSRLGEVVEFPMS